MSSTTTMSTLRTRVQRLKDLQAVSDLMSRHVYYNAAFEFDELLGTFAQHSPGVTVELADWGVFEGLAGVRRIMIDTLAGMIERHDEGMRRQHANLDRMDPRAGLLLENSLTSPVLEIAADGRTAKGLWMVMGAQSAFNPGAGGVEAAWTWVYFAVDFIREDIDNTWRIWHLRVAPRWRTPYSDSWAVTAGRGPMKPPPGMVPPSDRPPTGTPTDYAPDRTPDYELRAPVPYATFADTFSY